VGFGSLRFVCVALGERVCQTRQRVWTEKRPGEKALTDIFAGLGAVTSEYRCDSFEYPTACFEQLFCIDGGLMVCHFRGKMLNLEAPGW
jgi:hypothetical protein